MSKYQELMHYICYKGIEALHGIEKITGISYAEINVWLFLIIMPAAILGLIAWNFYLLGKLRALKGKEQHEGVAPKVN